MISWEKKEDERILIFITFYQPPTRIASNKGFLWVRVRLPFVTILSSCYPTVTTKCTEVQDLSTCIQKKNPQMGEHHAIHLYWLHKWYFLTWHYSVTFINSLSMLSFNFICEIYWKVKNVHNIYHQNKIILFLKSNLNKLSLW